MFYGSTTSGILMVTIRPSTRRLLSMPESMASQGSSRSFVLPTTIVPLWFWKLHRWSSAVWTAQSRAGDYGGENLWVRDHMEAAQGKPLFCD